MVKVKKLLRDENQVGVIFFIDRKTDALIAQEILRGLLHQNSVESYFGYDDDFNEVLVFDYPCNKEIIIGYDHNRKQYFYSSQLVKPKKSTK